MAKLLLPDTVILNPFKSSGTGPGMAVDILTDPVKRS
jgi:hypothetical protein